MKPFKMTCENCNASLDLDLDNIEFKCPYCGSKLMIDMAVLSNALSEREKTKQLQIQEEHETERERMDEKSRRILLIVAVGLFVFSFFILLMLSYCHAG